MFRFASWRGPNPSIINSHQSTIRWRYTPPKIDSAASEAREDGGEERRGGDEISSRRTAEAFSKDLKTDEHLCAAKNGGMAGRRSVFSLKSNKSMARNSISEFARERQKSKVGRLAAKSRRGRDALAFVTVVPTDM